MIISTERKEEPMKKIIANLLEKASVNYVDKEISSFLWGEKEIPKEILEEINELQEDDN